MIVNGYIQVKTTTGGGMDANGRPQAVTPVWGDAIDAHIKMNTRNNRGKYDGGKFTVASYLILVEMVDDFDPKRIKITHNGQGVIGEFEVQAIQYLSTVQQIEIQV